MPSPEDLGPSKGHPEDHTFRFGPFHFDERTGEIARRDAEEVELARLSPQPARLLAHLIRRHPDLVSGDEIRELLWPDTEVEFEQSLHTCIRQIRAALGDSASAPRYIETIPRRGYRFLAEVEPGDGATEGRPSRTAPSPSGARPVPARQRLGIGVGLAVVLVVIALMLRAVVGGATTPIRIAVMPFEPLAGQSLLPPDNDLAESIVALLVAARGPTLEVIGPSTTEAYDGRPSRLLELIDAHRIDYVVNARQTGGDAPPRVLIEIIRADGAHVWVRDLDDLPDRAAAAAIIAQATVDAVTADAESRDRATD